jgi:two-component system cell cycle sensor histidine kinase/response regulator CckA
MEQVLMNLAVNARDVMPNGGTVTIETATVDDQEAARRWGDELTPGSYVLLSVWNGIGGASEPSGLRGG